jgi:hypothetical protein
MRRSPGERHQPAQPGGVVVKGALHGRHRVGFHATSCHGTEGTIPHGGRPELSVSSLKQAQQPARAYRSQRAALTCRDEVPRAERLPRTGPSAYQAAASTAGSPVRVIGGRAWAASPAAQPDVLARGGSAVNGTPILTPLAACRAGSVSRAVDICAAELLSRVPAWRHLLLAGRQSGRAGSSVPCQALAGRGLAAIHWRSTKYSGSRGGP